MSIAASNESLPSLTITISSIISPSYTNISDFLLTAGTKFDKTCIIKLEFSQFLKILKFFIQDSYIINNKTFLKLKGKEFVNIFTSNFFSAKFLDSI